jgi:hypothetical protein
MSLATTSRRPGRRSNPLAQLDRDKLEFGPIQVPRARDRAAIAKSLRARREMRTAS